MKIHLLLRDNIIVGQAGWTNNNCESINHVLKQYTQWRPQQLYKSCVNLSSASTQRWIMRCVVAANISSIPVTPSTAQPSLYGRKCLSSSNRRRVTCASDKYCHVQLRYHQMGYWQCLLLRVQERKRINSSAHETNEWQTFRPKNYVLKIITTLQTLTVATNTIKKICWSAMHYE